MHYLPCAKRKQRHDCEPRKVLHTKVCRNWETTSVNVPRHVAEPTVRVLKFLLSSFEEIQLVDNFPDNPLELAHLSFETR